MSHREKECTEAYCIQGNGSHRGTIGAWRNGGYLPFLLEILCPKHLPQKLIRNLYASSPSLIVPLASPTGVFAFLEVV